MMSSNLCLENPEMHLAFHYFHIFSHYFHSFVRTPGYPNSWIASQVYFVGGSAQSKSDRSEQHLNSIGGFWASHSRSRLNASLLNITSNQKKWTKLEIKANKHRWKLYDHFILGP